MKRYCAKRRVSFQCVLLVGFRCTLYHCGYHSNKHKGGRWEVGEVSLLLWGKKSLPTVPEGAPLTRGVALLAGVWGCGSPSTSPHTGQEGYTPGEGGSLGDGVQRFFSPQ